MTMRARFWSHVRKTKKCWVWTGCKCSGRYGNFRVDGKMQLAHRVAWTLTRGRIRKGRLILHRCDNGFCVRPSHLFSGDQFDNMRDMFAKGRNKTPHGSRNGLSKLTPRIVRRIRRLARAKLLDREIAVLCRTSRANVNKIRNRKAWVIVC